MSLPKLIGGFLVAGSTALAAGPDFVKDVQPVLEFNCIGCHRDGNHKGGLNLMTKADAFKGGDNGPVIIPGKPEKSFLYTSTVLPKDDDNFMPPPKERDPLTKEDTEILRLWILNGAQWPESVTLISRKKVVEDSPEKELALIKDIHSFIAKSTTEKAAADMKAYRETIPGTPITFDLVTIPAGEFTMGSPDSEPSRKPDEGPQHKVKIDPFWMGKTEVTWDEFELFMYPEYEKRVMSDTPVVPPNTAVADAVTRPTKPYVEMSFGMGKINYPAISMTHHAASTYCKWLSAKTGHFYRLPTEAEWEYACRAGASTTYSFGNDPKELEAYAWFDDNSDWKYQRVGKKKPNAWGLHDMHGNVAEWVLDEYRPDAYKQFATSLAINPWAIATKPYPHVARGGSWNDKADMLRSAARQFSDPSWKRQDPQLPKSIWYLTDAKFIGFRVIRPLATPSAEEIGKYWTGNPRE